MESYLDEDDERARASMSSSKARGSAGTFHRFLISNGLILLILFIVGDVCVILTAFFGF